MKKYFFKSILIILTIILTIGVIDVSAVTSKKQNFTPYINYRDPLTHTYKCLTKDKSLNVVYFGGSVTAGYGASAPDTYSWRALSQKWFQTNFPQVNFNFINTAIGESGTYLGVYRVQQDVIAKKPDLLFIEYAINDSYQYSSKPDKAKEMAALQYESIVREVRTALPECDIVTLLVTDQNALRLLPDLYKTAAGHEIIAAAYNIPTINVGAALVNSLNDVTAEWNKYFIDTVHPSDSGYAKYFECIEEYLYNSLLATDFSKATETHTLPKLQSEYLLDGNRISAMGSEMKKYITYASDFDFSEELFYGPTDTPHYGYYHTDKTDINSEITITFTGTELAIWSNFYNDSRMDVSIDYTPFVTMNGANHAPTLICSGLRRGEHTIIIRPTYYGEKSGTKMIIGALFMRDETLQTSKNPKTESSSQETISEKEITSDIASNKPYSNTKPKINIQPKQALGIAIGGVAEISAILCCCIIIKKNK